LPLIFFLFFFFNSVGRSVAIGNPDPVWILWSLNPCTYFRQHCRLLPSIPASPSPTLMLVKHSSLLSGTMTARAPNDGELDELIPGGT
jgi:hypothetical protein